MARKLSRNDPKHPHHQPAPVDDPAKDLYVAMPDVPITVGARDLVVREPSFAADLILRAQGKPLIDDLMKMVDSGASQEAGVEDYLDLLAKHADLVRELMADTIDDCDADFLDSLSGIDGQRLQTVWWTVVGRFFWRSVVGRLRDRTVLEMRRKAEQAKRAGGTSSTPSPAADRTEISSTSSTTTPGAS